MIPNSIEETAEIGEDTCFLNIEDTGIPALQQWCHRLTVASRERVARPFLTRLSAFSSSLKAYAQGVGNVTADDRALLQDRWETADIDEIQDLFRDLRESKRQGVEYGASGASTGIAVQLCEVRRYDCGGTAALSFEYRSSASWSTSVWIT